MLHVLVSLLAEGLFHSWSTSIAISSIFSSYFQESDVEGIDVGIADMYIDDPIAEITPALQDLAHQQAWENGEIDYRGRDKFENIQKRIEEFIGVLRDPTDMPTFLVF